MAKVGTSYSHAVPIHDPVTGDIQVKVIDDSTQKDIYTCSLCESTFLNVDEYLDHILLHNKEGDGSEPKSAAAAVITTPDSTSTVILQYKCTFCGKVFDKLGDLKLHNKQCAHKKAQTAQHQEDGYNVIVANENGHNSMNTIEETVAAERALQMINSGQGADRSTSAPEGGVYAPQGVFQCNICHRILKDMFTLKTHQLTHSTDRPYVCEFPGCDFSFKTKGSLKRHTRRHTGDRPFKCELCGRSFRESGALTRHQKSRTPCVTRKDADLPLYGKRKGFSMANKDKIIHTDDEEENTAAPEGGTGEEPSMISIRLNRNTNMPEINFIGGNVMDTSGTQNSELPRKATRVFRIVKQLPQSSNQQIVNLQSQEGSNGYTSSTPIQFTNTHIVGNNTIETQQEEHDSSVNSQSEYTIVSPSKVSSNMVTTLHDTEPDVDIGEQGVDHSIASQLTEANNTGLPVGFAPLSGPIKIEPVALESADVEKASNSNIKATGIDQPKFILSNSIPMLDAQVISDKIEIKSEKNPDETGENTRTTNESSSTTLEKINLGGTLRTVKIVQGSHMPVLKNAKILKVKTASLKDGFKLNVPPGLIKVKALGGNTSNESAISSQSIETNVSQENTFSIPNETTNTNNRIIASEANPKTVQVACSQFKNVKIIKLPASITPHSRIQVAGSKIVQIHKPEVDATVRDLPEETKPELRDDLEPQATTNEDGELNTGEILGLNLNQMEQVEEVVTSDAMEQSTASDDVIDDHDNNDDESNQLADVTKDLEEEEGGATVSRADACNACGKTFSTTDQMKTHLKTHLLFSGYSCPVEGCKSVVAGPKELVSHLQVVHRTVEVDDSIEVNDDESAYQGKKVNPETANVALRQLLELQGNLDTVMHTVGSQTVKVLHACPVCSRTFTLSYLKMHIRAHTGERPYQCKLCNKTFRTRDTLTKHTQSHNNQRNYRCGECGKMFKRISHVREHLKVHSNERNYPCTKCDKSFKSANACKVHMRTHIDVLPHKCTHCPKSFREKHALERHIRTHTGEKPYICKYCGRGFAEHGTLNRHMKAKVPCTSSFNYNYSKQQASMLADQGGQDSNLKSTFSSNPGSVRVLRNLDDNRMLMSDTHMDDTSMDEPSDMLHISLDSAAASTEPTADAERLPSGGVEGADEEEDEAADPAGQNNVLAEFSTLAADTQQYVLDESGNAMQVVEVSEEQAEELNSSLYQEQSVVESMDSQPQYIVVGEEDGVSSLLNPQTGETIHISSKDLNSVV